MGLLDLFGNKGLVGSVLDVLKSTGLVKDPESELKATQALMAFESDMRKLDAAQMESVNATIREEAKSEHWMVWSWRPLVGYTFCLTIINNYVLIPYFASSGLQPIIIPGELWSAMLVILGVSAGTRGLEKWQALKK
jgi:hypothetical protein